MMRGIATAFILLLFALDLYMPSSALGRRGTERTVRAHVASAAKLVGQPLPALDFEDEPEARIAGCGRALICLGVSLAIVLGGVWAAGGKLL